jgi:hypothetical protein
MRSVRFLENGRARLRAAAIPFGLAVCLSGPAFAQDLPEGLAQKLAEAEAACNGFENGEFSPGWGAVRRVDLDGDLDMDWVLDEVRFQCSSAVSLYCGTGGCMSHFSIDDNVHSMLNQGWEAVTLGPFRVVLADVHGSQCGGINPTPCVTASTWDPENGVWRSTAAIWE